MDNFAVIYKILAALEKAMDIEDLDISAIGPEVLGITKTRWDRYMEMLVDSGYIKGVKINTYSSGVSVQCVNIKITLKGLEYLTENSFMKKAYRAVKGIVDIMP